MPLDLGRAVEELQAVDAALRSLRPVVGALVALRFTLEGPVRVRRLAVCAGFACTARAAVRPIAGRPRSSRGRCGKERFDVGRQITSLESPLLVLCGERDRVTVRSRSLSIRVPQANFELIPDAGHVAKLRQPGRVQAYSNQFSRPAIGRWLMLRRPSSQNRVTWTRA